eukprot:g40486.t1
MIGCVHLVCWAVLGSVSVCTARPALTFPGQVTGWLSAGRSGGLFLVWWYRPYGRISWHGGFVLVLTSYQWSGPVLRQAGVVVFSWYRPYGQISWHGGFVLVLRSRQWSGSMFRQPGM